MDKCRSKIVYRLEHVQTHTGPFSYICHCCSELPSHNLPSSMADTAIVAPMSQQGWLFAWDSRSLFDAFCSPHLLKKMKTCGYDMVKYRLKGCYMSFPDGQIMFDPITATIVKSRSKKS